MNWPNFAVRWPFRLATAMAVVAALVLYSYLLQPISNTSSLVYDAMRWAFTAVIFGLIIAQAPRMWQLTYGDQVPAPVLRLRTYAVTKRFGLQALFVTIGVVSLLVTALKALWMPPLVIIGLLGFLAAIAGAQFVFHGSPRRASMLAGSIIFIVAEMVLAINPAKLQSAASMPLSDFAFGTAYWTLAGALWGYVAGFFVGFIFMLTAAVDVLVRKRSN